MALAMGIVLANDNDDMLRELTSIRTRASLPFGGRYRLIDFVLSNFVNSGISSVGVITKNNYNSLMDHIASGKDWDLNRKRNGIFILPPFGYAESTGLYKGKIDALSGALHFIRRCKEEYVIITGSSIVCNMSFDDALENHIHTGADITVIYQEANGSFVEKGISPEMVIQTDNDGRVIDIAFKSDFDPTEKVSMDIYIVRKKLLEYLVIQAMAHNVFDFEKDILQKKINELKINGYHFDGYVARINCVKSYFHFNMELLNSDVKQKIFKEDMPIYTKVKDQFPVYYGSKANVVNSLIADGCTIEGEVENCIIFRGVRIHKRACVRNCIIMQHSEIMENSQIDYAILDKEVMVQQGRTLIGLKSYPVVLTKGSIV